MKTEKRVQIHEDSLFYQDLVDQDKVMSFNGKPMSRGYWNLIISIRDCGLYSKGLKPHRFWKITDVKKYFKITGNAETMKIQLEQIRELITQK